MLLVIGLGGYLLCILFAGGMIKILETATIIVFLSAPILAFLYLVVIRAKAIPQSHRPPIGLLVLAYIGLTAMTLFTLYYLWDLLPFG